ncbi:unnamed protein product, partial [Timema podura]|nr:unnamed protein product [Timema podura]
MYTTKNPSLRIKQDDLKCKNGCGYYGNSEWGGYCSQCYRKSVQHERLKKTDYEDRVQVTEKHARPSSTSFSKFEEKKRQQVEKKPKLLKMFKKSSSVKGQYKYQ